MSRFGRSVSTTYGTFIARNSPLFNYPELLDTFIQYVHIPKDVAQAYQLTDCVVDITFSVIIVSALPTTDSPPLTIVRSVRHRATDYTRLAELDKLVRRITSGGVSVSILQSW